MLTCIRYLALAAFCTANLVIAQELSLANVTITMPVAYGGTGCPKGSLSVNYPFKNNTNIFYSTFDAFNASIGPDVPTTRNRAICQFSFNLQYPNGFRFATKTASYRGTVKLDSGITASLKSLYYLAGSETETSVAADFTGPSEQEYFVGDKESQWLTWSPCGAASTSLNVNAQVRLSRVAGSDPNATGSISGTEFAVNDLWWKKCIP